VPKRASCPAPWNLISQDIKFQGQTISAESPLETYVSSQGTVSEDGQMLYGGQINFNLPATSLNQVDPQSSDSGAIYILGRSQDPAIGDAVKMNYIGYRLTEDACSRHLSRRQRIGYFGRTKYRASDLEHV
jgi:hypothetical protein